MPPEVLEAFSARKTSRSVVGALFLRLILSGFSAASGIFQVLPVKKAPGTLLEAQ
jgi:hypothetical protein